jgi:cytidyltransferase-like protein
MAKAVYTVGRFQPPTIGHQRLIEAVKDMGGDAYVFVSKVQKPGTDPLPSELKVRALREMFPSGVTFVDTAKCDPACGGPVAAHAYLLAKGYKDITLVAGSDRAPIFNESADMWTKGRSEGIAPPHFKGLERETDGRGAKAMSGTKARALAVAGDKAAFANAVRVGGITDETIHALYRTIQDGDRKRRGGRKTKRNKASGRALSRRGSRSRTGSSRTTRSSCGLRGYC